MFFLRGLLDSDGTVLDAKNQNVVKWYGGKSQMNWVMECLERKGLLPRLQSRSYRSGFVLYEVHVNKQRDVEKLQNILPRMSYANSRKTEKLMGLKDKRRSRRDR